MRLPEILLRCGRWLSLQGSRTLDFLRRPGAKREREAVADEAKARARFWDGVREGRREAEARSSERNR